MDQNVPHKTSRFGKGRNRFRNLSRNVDNLHVIKPSVPAAISHPPEYIRTVTMTPKKDIQTPEPVEGKGIVIPKTPVAARVFAGQKGTAMSFTKKKINAAKNFLKQHNKESPVKNAISTKVDSKDDSVKPSLSSNDPSTNNSLSNSSNNNITSNSSNGSLASKPSNNSNSRKSRPLAISHQSHSVLALYEVDMSYKPKNINTTKNTPSKEKKDVIAQKEDSGSSWVPVDMKKVIATIDLSTSDKDKISVKEKNIVENQNRAIYDQNISKEKKKPMKEIPPTGERTLVPRYPGSLRHEEEPFNEKKYGLSRNSKMKKNKYYERESKRNYKESYPYYFSKKSRKRRKKSFHEYTEALEDVSDVPLDEDFEEVETASVEDSSKQSEIPVGFRKYKIRYLTSKSMGFFKPKLYHICQDRTVVSCLNMEEESVDVVSEAEYEADHTVAEKDSKDIKGDKLNSDCCKLKTSPKNAKNVALETTNEPVEMEHSVSSLAITGKKLGKSEPVLSGDILLPTDVDNYSTAKDSNLIDTGINLPSIKEKQEVISSSKFYYTCIPETDSPDFYQGRSLFQKYLDESESHLIGLEYIVEVRNADKTQVKKYHCGLCLEQLSGVSTDGQIVTNHLSSYKHASAYMEVK